MCKQINNWLTLHWSATAFVSHFMTFVFNRLPCCVFCICMYTEIQISWVGRSTTLCYPFITFVSHFDDDEDDDYCTQVYCLGTLLPMREGSLSSTVIWFDWIMMLFSHCTFFAIVIISLWDYSSSLFIHMHSVFYPPPPLPQSPPWER